MEDGKPQLGLSVHLSEEGKSFMAPYVRLSGVLVDGVLVSIGFGDFIVTVVRPQQPPSENGDETDAEGAQLLASIVVGLQDQVLRGLRAIPGQLDITLREVEKKGGGGRKKREE